jgi:hypothetical protein
MTTKPLALVTQISSLVEEEVTLEINRIVLTCFVNVCPYPIHEGETYPVSFEASVPPALS